MLLIVNVASECGYTHTHYLSLVKLQRELEQTGLFQVLAFPCNQFGQQEPKVIFYILLFSWLHSIVVRTLVSAGELSLSCARLLAGWVTILRLSRLLSVSQHGQLSHPSLRGR